MKYRVIFSEGEPKEIVADNFYIYNQSAYDPCTVTFSRLLPEIDPYGGQTVANVAYFQNVMSVEVISEDG